MPTSEVECRFWQKDGNCRKGDNCNFKHTPIQEQQTERKTWQRERPESQNRRIEFKPKPRYQQEEIKDEYDQDEGEGEYDAEGEDSNIEEKELQNITQPSFVEKPVKKIDLRDRINKIKDNKPTANPQVMDVANPFEMDSDDVSYHSDTFGEVKKPKFTGKRSKPSMPTLTEENKTSSIIAEIPQLEAEQSDSNSSSDGGVEQPIDLPRGNVVLPYNLIKISDENPVFEIGKIIQEDEKFESMGKKHPMVDQRSQLMRMCSIEEAYSRQSARDLSIFEMDPQGTDLSVIEKDKPPQVKPEWAVKIYKRSAADVKLDDPLKVNALPECILNISID